MMLVINIIKIIVSLCVVFGSIIMSSGVLAEHNKAKKIGFAIFSSGCLLGLVTDLIIVML